MPFDFMCFKRDPSISAILPWKEISVKTREQAAYLVENLLARSLHKTAVMLLDSNFVLVLANVLSQDSDQRSTDLVLSLLGVIETLSGNSDFRAEICKSKLLITNIGLLLKVRFTVLHLAKSPKSRTEPNLNRNLCSSYSVYCFRSQRSAECRLHIFTHQHFSYFLSSSGHSKSSGRGGGRKVIRFET